MSDDTQVRFRKLLATRHDGEVYGEVVFAALANACTDAGLRPELVKFVDQYAADEAAAPADGLALARHVTRHESALLEFVDRELAGRAEESTEPVLALLARPPAPER